MKQHPAVKRVEDVKKPVAKPEIARVVAGKELLKAQAKPDLKAKKNGAAGPDGTQPAAPTGKEESDAPLLDLSDAAVRKMITTRQDSAAMSPTTSSIACSPPTRSPPSRSRTPWRCSTRWASTSSRAKKQEEGEGAELPAVAAGRQVAEVSEKAEETYDRTDDPVRMYLREMGSVELLVARRRNRHRQAHRSRPRADDRRAVRRPADLRSAHRLARRAQRRQSAPPRHHRSRSHVRRRSPAPRLRVRCPALRRFPAWSCRAHRRRTAPRARRLPPRPSSRR